MNKQPEQPEKLSARTKLAMAFILLFLLTFAIGGGAFLACRGVKRAIENPTPASTATQTDTQPGSAPNTAR